MRNTDNGELKMTRVVLASASPRRRELLAQIGVIFEVCPANGPEIMEGDTPGEICRNLARQKAKEAAARLLGEPRRIKGDGAGKTAASERILVIGADTIVVKDGRILGKPEGEEGAKEMLRFLSGQEHFVYTGVCCLYIEDGAITEKTAFTEETKVCVAALSEEEIGAYVRTGDPLDKAGAYGIQGPFARHIEKIDGDYYNVVGLPLCRLYTECLKEVL